MKKKLLTALLVGIVATGALAGCGADKANAGEAREIIVAVAPGYYPITYADDNGVAQGYDVEVFKAVDELLPEYTFKFEIADKETMNVGVQTGTYQAGINSLFKTEARLETYYMPENNLGYTPVGIIQKADDNINSLSEAYERGLKIGPTTAAGGIRFVIEDWNNAHPDQFIDVELVTQLTYADQLSSIKTGEFDYAVNLIPVFNLQKPETVDGLKISDPIDVVPTFTIINKEETAFGDKVNEALGKLKADGTLSKISVETFGYDIFEIAEK